MTQTDPPRLFEAPDAPAELQRLLDGAHDDVLSRAQVERITVGVQAALGGSPGPTDPSGSPTPDGGSASSTGTGLGSTGTATKLGIALAVAAVAGGGLWLARSSGHAGEPGLGGPPDSVLVAASSPPAAEAGPSCAPGEAAPTPLAEGDPSGPASPLAQGEAGGSGSRAARDAAAAPRPPEREPEPTSSASLVAEHDLLRRARASLERDPRRALGLTGEHRQRFPRGMLVQEREVIAIEALARLGQRDAARARASQFAEDYPASPHRRRVAETASGQGGERP